MPTYEYACPKCGHQFDHFQPMSAAVLRKCPKCGKPGLKRLIGGGAGLIFKGSGFYITDYRKSPGGGAAGEAKPAPSDTKPPAAETKKPAAPSGEGKPAAPAPKKD